MTQTFGSRTNISHVNLLRLSTLALVDMDVTAKSEIYISGKNTRRNLIDTPFSDLAPYIALTSFAIAALALVFSIRGDRRKTGIDIRCDFSVASSVWSSERWVAEVRLENLKDRPISIYKIYLEVGHGLYIEVENLIDTPFSDLAPYIALTSFAIAALALVFSIRGDRRKTGIDIRCDFSVASSVWSSERWVAEVRLENLKDRPISIYKIYLEVGHGLYIEVENFTETPLSLDDYSVYQKKYDPIEFYSNGMRRVTGFLDGKKTRQRILLTTSQGRYYPRRRTNTFNDPLIDTISKNYSTGGDAGRRLPPLRRGSCR